MQQLLSPWWSRDGKVTWKPLLFPLVSHPWEKTISVPRSLLLHERLTVWIRHHLMNCLLTNTLYWSIISHTALMSLDLILSGDEHLRGVSAGFLSRSQCGLDVFVSTKCEWVCVCGVTVMDRWPNRSILLTLCVCSWDGLQVHWEPNRDTIIMQVFISDIIKTK